MILQRTADRPGVPWRNGLGVQYEIAADGPLPDGWDWRLSTADISTDVLFSSFLGVDRFFCVGVGNGVVLTIDGIDHRCGSRSVTHFRGDAQVVARLIDGPMKAINLMVRDGAPHRGYHVALEGSTVQAIAVVAFEGGAEVRLDSEVRELEDLDALVGGQAATVEVLRGAVIVVS